jgi:hypothetical protein
MRSIAALLIAAMPVSSGAAVLTPDGFGPLKIGMTRAQVVAALGQDRHPDVIGSPTKGCDEFQPRRAPPGLLVMIENDRVTRISIARNMVLRTSDGIGVGFRKTALLARLGRSAQVSNHAYDKAPAAYIDHWRGKPGASRGIRYEIGRNSQVTAIYAGTPSIRYVEGCL